MNILELDFNESEEEDDLKNKLKNKLSNSINLPEPSNSTITLNSIDCNIVENPDDTFINLSKLLLYLNTDTPIQIKTPIKTPNSISRKNQNNYSGNNNFYNQITVSINPYMTKNEIILKSNINFMLFSNGKIQIRGMKSPTYEDGKQSINILIDYIKKIPEKIYNIDDSKLYINNISVDLLKMHVNLGYIIDRLKLYNILKSLDYFVDYDSNNAPGIKIIIYYNNQTHEINKYKTNSNEIKITYIIFQSGKTSIDGIFTINDEPYLKLYLSNLIKKEYHKIDIDSNSYKNSDIKNYRYNKKNIYIKTELFKNIINKANQLIKNL